MEGADATGVSPSAVAKHVAMEDVAVAGRCSWIGLAARRGLLLFVGLFLVAGLVGSLRREGSQESLWLFDASGATGPSILGPAVLALAGVVLVAYAVLPAASSPRRPLTAAVLAGLALVATLNAITFYRVWAAGDIDPRVPAPLSLFLGALMGWCAWGVQRAHAPTSADRRPGARMKGGAVVVAAFAACVLVFPLAQIVFFGTTDYRRAADVAVVFGAQVHPGGRASSTLTWRVDTACDLYRQGLVERLVMSGAVGDSGYDEAEIMREMAIERGVPATAIVVDSGGVNTEATVADTVRLFRDLGVARVLAVSNAYHLPRIKLAYRRQGQEVFTVPAVETRRIKETPRLWLREVPAFWVYYLRGLTASPDRPAVS
jgi:vancomycin permeability regulator SanA